MAYDKLIYNRDEKFAADIADGIWNCAEAAVHVGAPLLGINLIERGYDYALSKWYSKDYKPLNKNAPNIYKDTKNYVNNMCSSIASSFGLHSILKPVVWNGCKETATAFMRPGIEKISENFHQGGIHWRSILAPVSTPANCIYSMGKAMKNWWNDNNTANIPNISYDAGNLVAQGANTVYNGLSKTTSVIQYANDLLKSGANKLANATGLNPNYCQAAAIACQAAALGTVCYKLYQNRQQANLVHHIHHVDNNRNNKPALR